MTPAITANQAAIHPYQVVLSDEPTYWNLYRKLADLSPNPAGQSHILLKGAWHALERGQYPEAQGLADAAHKCHTSTFFLWRIDIELLKRQNQQVRIPKKLLEIAMIFQQKALPIQE